MEELSGHAQQQQKKEERDREIAHQHQQIVKKKRNKKILYGIILVIIILGISYPIYRQAKAPGKHDAFAQCLTDTDAKFYGSYQCKFCTQQKKLFGKSMKFVQYVECGPLGQAPAAICTNAGVKTYPTWTFPDAEIRAGLISLEDLSEISGCPL